MKNIEENNKLIAEFENLQKSLVQERDTVTGLLKNLNPVWVKYGVDKYKTTFTDDELDYHTSWDWLMPVVEKIEEIEDHDVRIMGTSVEVVDYDGEVIIKMITTGSKLKSVYLVVVEFIKWLNTQEVGSNAESSNFKS
jgi:hypothetical protein